MEAFKQTATGFFKNIFTTPSWSGLLKGVFCALVLANIKVLPLAWHVRYYSTVATHFLRRRSIPPSPSQLFAPATMLSHAPLLECDFNLHKSNSTYATDADIGRTHLLAHLTKRSFAQRRRAGKRMIYIAVAGVATMFHKEIPMYKRYSVTSRLLTWDDKKWYFVVTHFHGKDGKGEDVLYASMITKYCFKEGRKTVPPGEVWAESGILPERTEEGGVSLRESDGDSGVGSGEDAAKADFERMKEGKEEVWTWERVEVERERGRRLADAMMNLDDLKGEYKDGKSERHPLIGVF